MFWLYYKPINFTLNNLIKKKDIEDKANCGCTKK